MAAEMPGKVESKIKRRVDAAKNVATREVEIAKTFIGDLTGLRPVKAIIDLGVETLDNVGDLIKKQAEITREWVR